MTQPLPCGAKDMAKLSARGRKVVKEWHGDRAIYRLMSDGVLLRKLVLGFPTPWKVVEVSNRFPTQEALIAHLDSMCL